MKKILTELLIIAIMAAIVVACFFAYKYFTKDEIIEEEEEISSEPIFSLENYPKVDASLATQPLPECKAYIQEGYLYYGNIEDEEAEKIEGVSNAKSVNIYNIGSGINKVPFVVTEDGIVYRLNAGKKLVQYQELSEYKVDKIISHEGEMYDPFKLLLKDGTTKVVEVKDEI